MSEQPKRGRPPLPEGERATSTIVLRVTPRQKGAYVHEANRRKMTLANWIFAACANESSQRDAT